MSTVAKNTIKRSPSPYRVFEDAKAAITSSISWNQGDLLCLDTTAHTIRQIVADADTATFLGVADQTIVSGKYASPYVTSVDAAQGLSDVPGPLAGVDIQVILNTGDTFHYGDKVYPLGVAGGTQTVSTSSNTGARKACGFYLGSTVTAASGSTGLVHIESQFPYTY